MKITDTKGEVGTDVRVAAIAAAAAIVTALFSTIVSNMPPHVAPPTEAGVGVRSGTPLEIAIVPSRIEVFGLRSQDTAANDAQPPASASGS